MKPIRRRIPARDRRTRVPNRPVRFRLLNLLFQNPIRHIRRLYRVLTRPLSDVSHLIYE